jgi:hypothetical protein
LKWILPLDPGWKVLFLMLLQRDAADHIAAKSRLAQHYLLVCLYWLLW